MEHQNTLIWSIQCAVRVTCVTKIISGRHWLNTKEEETLLGFTQLKDAICTIICFWVLVHSTRLYIGPYSLMKCWRLVLWSNHLLTQSQKRQTAQSKSPHNQLMKTTRSNSRRRLTTKNKKFKRAWKSNNKPRNSLQVSCPNWSQSKKSQMVSLNYWALKKRVTSRKTCLLIWG